MAGNRDGRPAGACRRIAVIGGGFTGAAFALQALKEVGEPLSVVIVEPRAELGAGLAYSTEDPDHRLNAPGEIHFAVPDALDGFLRWFSETGGFARDPEAAAPGGGLFPRRREFGAYVADLVRPHLAEAAGAPGIEHLRARAAEVHERDGAMAVALDGGEALDADVVVLATGNRPAPPPRPFDGALGSHKAVLAAPWDPALLRAIAPDARVLLLGTSQTALDVIATLVRQGHRGPITAVSRRGRRPHARAAPGDGPPPSPWDRLTGPMPEFLAAAGPPTTVLGLMRTLRARCREAEAAGETWHGPFDELRDAVWRIWPMIPAADQRRFLRHLRPWYDVHRFRMPPQTEALVARAEADGLVAFRAARPVSAEADGAEVRVAFRDRGAAGLRSEAFDAVINCTGTVAGPGDDPLSRALELSGIVRPHPTGLGWEVDAECRAVGGDGRARERVFVFGPPSVGTFGDPIGSPFIVAQIHRAMPAVRAALASAAGQASRIETAPPR